MLQRLHCAIFASHQEGKVGQTQKISRLPGGLGHLADINGITMESNHHLSSEPNCDNTADVSSLTRACGSFCNFACL